VPKTRNQFMGSRLKGSNATDAGSVDKDRGARFSWTMPMPANLLR
jgi:hypothetical protein